MPVSYPDILIVGGGVIGLSTALQLADRGISVTVVDRQQVGTEASWAGAGMLPPGLHQPSVADGSPESRERSLRCLSNSIWPELSSRLLDYTGIDNGYRNCGAIEVSNCNTRLTDQLTAWHAEGIMAEKIDSRIALEQHIPGLAPEFRHAVWLPEFCQVRNPRHLKALRSACQLSGVEILENVPDLMLQTHGSVVTAKTSSRRFSTERICVTAGSWTAPILQTLNVSLPIEPVQGQMVQLRSPQLPFRCVIEQGSRYLVPRPDGLILVGSTEERVGFRKQTTNDGVRGLLEFGASLVPQLAHATVVRQWAGLRPGSPDGLPFLGRLDGFDNLYVGAGHFRFGLQMSTGSAQILADALCASPNESATVDVNSTKLR
jgi:glycine oxidase